MVMRMEYVGYAPGDVRCYAEIDHLTEKQWRVFLSNGVRSHTSWCQSLTSAQSRARVFIQSGQFPSERRTKTGKLR